MILILIRYKVKIQSQIDYYVHSPYHPYQASLNRHSNAIQFHIVPQGITYLHTLLLLIYAC